MSDFNLSEKEKSFGNIHEYNETTKEFKDTPTNFHYPKEEVKEFIRLSLEEDNDFYDREIRDKDLDKEEIVEICFKFFINRINKLAGDKLI